MRYSAIVLFLFVETLAIGQGFNKRYDDLGHGLQQTAFGIERTGSGWTIISGSDDLDSVSPGVWFYHASTVLKHIDAGGDVVWEKRAFRANHGVLPGWANCCDTIPGGGFVVGGASEDTTGRDEVYLMRFDAQGDTLWTRVFNGPTDEYYWIGRQVKCTIDGGFLIVGDMGMNIGVNGIDGFAVKTDSAGNELWRQFYGEAPPDWRAFTSCAIAPDNSYYLAGSFFPTEENGEHWVVRTDSLGNEVWSTTWGAPFSGGATHIITLATGEPVVFSGAGYAPGYAATRPYIAKLDSSDGSVVWEREYGALLSNHLFAAGKECPNGDLIAAGIVFESTGPNVQKGILARVSAEGDSLWMFSYFYQDSVISNGQGRFQDVLPTSDGGFIAAGAAYNPVGGPFPPGYSQDTWVVKVDSMGCVVPGCNSVGISEQATNLLDALSIFPNPAHGQATVQLTLPPSVAHLPLELSIVGMDGRVVQQQRIEGNGQHELALLAVSAGVYHVHITSEGKWFSGVKLVVE